MMFLIRTSFWLLVLVLLLPTDEDQQNQIYGTAQAAVTDVVGFCDRNPQTCATGEDAFEVFVQKAQYGAEVVMKLIDAQTGTDNVALDGNAVSQPVPTLGDTNVMPLPANPPLEPAAWDASASQDTLNSKDREAAWNGPGI